VTPLERVLSCIPGARRNARGWTARCPAHDDRGPSLSIGTGRDDRVLVRCFAGCSTEAIVAALGLTMAALFAPDTRQHHVDRPLRRASRENVEAFIVREIERQRRFRLDRYTHDTPNVRSSDVNAARERASAIFGIVLAPVERYAWEGWTPHDADPAWPILFDRACDELRRYLGGELRLALHQFAADVAARWLHDLARLESTARRRAA